MTVAVVRSELPSRAQPTAVAERPRPRRERARRVAAAADAALSARPAPSGPPRVAVVGAGIAGLACARTLADAGLEVAVFDRGRAPGGRMATRHRDGYAFDHGAQYFTARDARFASRVRSWADDGVVARWRGRLVARRDDGALDAMADEARWVGVPEMSAVCRHLAADLRVRQETMVVALERAGAAWRLRCADGAGAGPLDVVLVAAQAPRAADLLAPAPALAARAAAATLAPCQAAMVTFAAPVDPGFDGATVAGSPLAWAGRDASKPGRPPGERWVLHGAPIWSADHADDRPEEIVAALLDAFAALAPCPLPGVVHGEAHRWRHALVTRPVGEDCLYEPEAGIGACGDWCLGGRVEAAWLSGVALAGRVLGARG